MNFEPKIAAFLCKWGGYGAADLAGTSRIKYLPTFYPIKVPCAARVEMKHILRALMKSDGVLVLPCLKCHYASAKYQALKRIVALKKFLNQMGIDPERIKLAWLRASQARKFERVVKSFEDEIRERGPLKREIEVKGENE